MKRRSFLALLGGVAAALAVEDKLSAFGAPRLLGGDVDLASGLWTPDQPMPALPSAVDVKALLSAQRVLRELTITLDRVLPRNGRQLIVPRPGESFSLGDRVLAGDLSVPHVPTPAYCLDPVRGPVQVDTYHVDAYPAVLDMMVGCSGGLSMASIGACRNDDEARRMLDAWIEQVAQSLAFEINRRGMNTFATTHFEHVPADTEGASIMDRRLRLAIRSWRYYDEATRVHEFRFDVIGARV